MITSQPIITSLPIRALLPINTLQCIITSDDITNGNTNYVHDILLPYGFKLIETEKGSYTARSSDYFFTVNSDSENWDSKTLIIDPQNVPLGSRGVSGQALAVFFRKPIYNGVIPFLLAVLTSAPASDNILTTSVWP